MSLLVKICGLRTEADVGVAVAAGADAIGFVFAASPRQVTPAEARLAASALPANVIRVAVMRHPDRDEWRHVLDEYQPDVLQTDVEDYAMLEIPDAVQRWPVVREGVASMDDLPADTFLYEGKVSGRGETVDWQNAALLASTGNMILAGGLSADNVGAAISIVRPYGVDVSSGVESQPGRKDPVLIQNFIQAVRSAESIS